ncbi:hypothetical protein PVAP13_2KG287067 [Panicum virgatum]|uniref:Uncharacterized protein n=1 Tax=Panicum virgatum TaxID=38727 RepID=A0A8T0W0V3_PANVG|nr:hypothetical protein PVAP13_2KG287067 [Panicum virgatum]
MPAAMAPRRTGLTAELGCGRARAGGAQAGTARTAEEEGAARGLLGALLRCAREEEGAARGLLGALLRCAREGPATRHGSEEGRAGIRDAPGAASASTTRRLREPPPLHGLRAPPPRATSAPRPPCAASARMLQAAPPPAAELDPPASAPVRILAGEAGGGGGRGGRRRRAGRAASSSGVRAVGGAAACGRAPTEREGREEADGERGVGTPPELGVEEVAARPSRLQPRPGPPAAAQAHGRREGGPGPFSPERKEAPREQGRRRLKGGGGGGVMEGEDGGRERGEQ